jgi:hypothetical protein
MADDGGEPPLPPGWRRTAEAGPSRFTHDSGGWAVATLALHIKGRFPPYFNYVSRTWTAVAPGDDGSFKKALVLTPGGDNLPPLVAKAVAGAAARVKADGAPAAIRLPVKMDKPVPRLPQGW